MNAARWLLEQCSAEHAPETLVDGLADALQQDGLSLLRISAWLPTQHPELWGSQLLWRRGEGCKVVKRPHDIADTPIFQGTPAQAVLGGSRAIRQRLDVPREQLPFAGVLAEVADAGGIDYFIVPIDMGKQVTVTWVSFAIDRVFTDAELAALEELRPILSLHFQLLCERYAKRSLLDVYLGHNAARHVLAGAFHRGGGTVLEAAMWFCDMRGFTGLGDRLDPREVVAILDRYFECVADPIESNGGEILKFVGDAALAIFPIDDDPREPCRRARIAAEQALANLEQLRANHPAWPPLAMGVALHLGDVFYGNIGGKSRLDFTVIGAAVNEVCRVESLCKTLATPFLMTAAFAEALGADDTIGLGDHALRGVADRQELRTLRRFAPT